MGLYEKLMSFFNFKTYMYANINEGGGEEEVNNAQEMAVLTTPKQISSTTYRVFATQSSYSDVLKTVISLKFRIGLTFIVDDEANWKGADNRLLNEFLDSSRATARYIKITKENISQYQSTAVSSMGFNLLDLSEDEYGVLRTGLGDLKRLFDDRKVWLVIFYNLAKISKAVFIFAGVVWVLVSTLDQVTNVLALAHFSDGFAKKYMGIVTVVPAALLASLANSLGNSWLKDLNKSMKIVNSLEACGTILAHQVSKFQNLHNKASAFQTNLRGSQDNRLLRPELIDFWNSLKKFGVWMDEFLELIQKLNEAAVSQF